MTNDVPGKQDNSYWTNKDKVMRSDMQNTVNSLQSPVTTAT